MNNWMTAITKLLLLSFLATMITGCVLIVNSSNVRLEEISTDAPLIIDG